MTITEALKHPFFIALWMSIITIGVPILTYTLHKKSNDGETLKKLLDSKVDKEICKSFKSRIGKESDEHKRDIDNLEVSVAYIKGKMED